MGKKKSEKLALQATVNPVEKRGILGPAIEAAFRNNYPFERYSQTKNIFDVINDPDRAYHLTVFIDSFVDYIFDCANIEMWIMKPNITKDDRNKILLKRNNLKNLLDRLLPKQARKQAAHPFLRQSESFPGIMNWMIDYINQGLNLQLWRVKRDSKFRIKDHIQKKQEAVKRYLSDDLESFYDLVAPFFVDIIRPKNKFLKTISIPSLCSKPTIPLPEIAINIISQLFNCSPDKISETRSYSKKNPR